MTIHHTHTVKTALLALTISAIAGIGPLNAQNQTPANVPLYQEQAQAAGIDQQYTGPWEFFVGGGAAALDCNQDRVPDVFIAGGDSPAKLYLNQSLPGGELRFAEIPVPADGPPLTNVTGAYPVNLDNDQYMDLAVLRLGENILLKGGPDCRFTSANDLFGFDGAAAWTTGFSAIWEGDSPYPTLAFGNYIDRDAPGSPWGTCEDNRLVRGRGQTSPVYDDNIALSPGYCSLSLLFTDWDNSGNFDLRITNDRQYYRGGQEQLWNLNDGTDPSQYSAADGWQKLEIWGMGIAQGDLNGDARPDYAMTSMGDTKLQILDADGQPGAPQYRDIAFQLNATAQRPYQGDNSKPSTGWHSQFADFNNDGLLDLYIAKGNVDAMPEFAAYDPDNLLLRQGDGTFVERGGTAGIALDTRGRGALVEDFNSDGLLDLLVVNREAPVSLFRNLGISPDQSGAVNNFLAIELDNGAINRQAVGARIVVKTADVTQTRTVQIGGGHASGQIGFTHIGLGPAQQATVTVQWPDGQVSQPYSVTANRFVVLSRASTQPAYWDPDGN